MRMLVSLLLVAATAFGAGARNSLVWLDDVHQLGAFSEDLERVRCVYRAVNVDSVPVSVIAARANCGCTVPSYPKEAVQPGDTLRIAVEYNAAGRPGRFAKKIYIDTSDGMKKTLDIKGTVVAAQNTLKSRYPIKIGKVHIDRRVVAFGSATKGGILTGGINIYNPTDHPIKPLVSDKPKFVKGYVSPAVIPVGESGFLTLTAQTDEVDEWGTIADSFLLTPDPESAPADSVRIDVALIVNEDFSKLTPAQLSAAPTARPSTQTVDFDRIKGKKPIKQTFTIHNSGRSPLIVRRVTTAEKALTVSLSDTKIKCGGEAAVSVVLDPTKLPGDTPLNARINFIVNVPGAPHLTVRVVGTR